MNKYIDLAALKGQTLSHIDIDPENNVILLTTNLGQQVRIYHDQNCCESVGIETTEGEWRELIGKPLMEASHEAGKDGESPSEYAESWTRTTLTFKVDGATVISRWIGESNGYYSESVDIEEITRPTSPPLPDGWPPFTDATSYLVAADWWDDHNEPAKAELLRNWAANASVLH